MFAGTPAQALYIIAIATGLRQGDLLGLRWVDVDLDARRLTVRHSLVCVGGKLVLLEPKTSRSRRMVVLPEMAVSALRVHRARQRMERLVAGLDHRRAAGLVEQRHRAITVGEHLDIRPDVAPRGLSAACENVGLRSRG